MDAITFTTCWLAICLCAVALWFMIERERKQRVYKWYEKAVIVLFCLLWLVLVLLNIGLAWYLAYPIVFGAGFLLLRWHYGKLRRIVKLEE